jgi:hypothetical protein
MAEQIENMEESQQVDQVEQTAQDQKPQPPKAHKLYDNLIADGYTSDNLGTKEEFVKAMSDSAKADKFYSNLTKEGYTIDNLGSKSEFIQSLSQKKNDGQDLKSGGQNGKPPAPSPFPSPSQGTKWEENPLNPLAAANKAQAKKEEAQKIMPQPTPTIGKKVAPTKTTPQRTPTAKLPEPSEEDEGFFSKAAKVLFAPTAPILSGALETSKDYLKYAWNKTLETVGRMGAGGGELFIDALSMGDDPNIPKEEMLKTYRNVVAKNIRQAPKKYAGASLSEEKTKEFDDNFVASTVAGLPGIMVQAAVPFGGGFIADAIDTGIETINNTEEGRKLPESQKTIFGLGAGIAMGGLTALGIDKILGKQTSKVANNLAVKTFADLMAKNEGQAITKEMFEEAIKQNSKSLYNKLISTGGKLAESSLVGGLFSAGTEATNEISKQITNKLTEKQIFDPFSWGKFNANTIRSFGHGAATGFALGAITVPFNQAENGIKNEVLKAKTPQDIEALKTQVVEQVSQGSLDPIHAESIVNIIDSYNAANGKVPADMPDREQKVELVKQKDDLKQAATNKLNETKTVDDAFHPQIQQEATALLNRANELNQEITGQPSEPAKHSMYADPLELPELKEQITDIQRRIDLGGADGEKAKIELTEIKTDPAKFYENRKDEAKNNLTDETELNKALETYDNIINKIKQYDKENISGLSGEVRVGEKPIEAQPVEGRGAQEIGGGRDIQAQGIEGEGKGVEGKVGEVTAKAPTESTIKALEDVENKIKEGNDINENDIIGLSAEEIDNKINFTDNEINTISEYNKNINELQKLKDDVLKRIANGEPVGEKDGKKITELNDKIKEQEKLLPQGTVKGKVKDGIPSFSDMVSFEYNEDINKWKGKVVDIGGTVYSVSMEGNMKAIPFVEYDAKTNTYQAVEKPDRAIKYGNEVPSSGNFTVIHSSPSGKIEKFDESKLGKGYQREEGDYERFEGVYADDNTNANKILGTGYGKVYEYNLEFNNSISEPKAEKLLKQHEKEIGKKLSRKEASRYIKSLGYDMVYRSNNDGTFTYIGLDVNKIKPELPKQEKVGEKVTPTEEVKKVEEVKVEAPKEEVKVEAEVPKQKEGEIDHKEIRKDIQEQVNAKDKEARDTQQKSIDEAKADKEKVLNNDKETIDKYVKKSGYKLITEETKHPLGGDKTFKDRIGQYYKQTSGLSVTTKTGKQIALDAIEAKSKLRPSGLKVNAYENSQRAAIDFEKGKISIDEFNEILKKDGLNAPKSLEVKAEVELPKQKEQPKRKASDGAVLNRVDAKKVYQEVGKTDEPVDAMGAAQRWLATGGKVNRDSFSSEVTGFTKSRGAAKTTVSEDAMKSEFTGSDKNLPSINKAAHDIWESFPEHIQDNVTDQDVRNALIDQLQQYNKRVDLSRDYLQNYSPETAIEKYYKDIEERENVAFEKEMKDLNEWMQQTGEEEGALKLEEDYVTNLIKQYEEESRNEPRPIEGEDKGVAEGKTTGVAEEVSGTKGVGQEKPTEPTKPTEPKPADVEPPVPPTISKQGILEGGEDALRGITMEDNANRRDEIGMPERMPNPETVEEWRAEAEKQIADGYNINNLIEKMEKGEQTNKVENEISRIFAATLDAEVKRNPSNENIDAYERLIKAREKSSSEIGRALRSLQGLSNPFENISDFYVAKKEANKVDNLTDAQKAEVQKDFENIQKARDEYEKKWKDAEAKFAEMQAQNELLRQQKEKEGKKFTKEGKRDFTAERKDLKEQLKNEIQKYKNNTQKLGISSSGGASDFAITVEMAKIIGKIAKSHVEEVGAKLSDVTQRTFDDVKDLFDGITSKDIHDVIAGKYSERKETKSELLSNLRQVQAEAKLLNELDRVLAREPKDEKQRIERNQKLADLRRQINDVKKSGGLEEYSQEAKAEKATKAAEENIKELEDKLAKNDLDVQQAQKVNSPELEVLRKKQKQLRDELESKRKEEGIGKYSEEARAKKAIEANKRKEEKIKERLANNDFDPEAKRESIYDSKEFKSKNPKLYNELLDSQVKKQEAELEFHKKLVENEMANMGKVDKFKQVLTKARGTLKAIFAGIDDSAVGVQNWFQAIVNPSIGARAIKDHVLDFWSQKRFDRNIEELHNSPDWNMIKESGLQVSEPKSLLEAGKEEMFPDRFKAIIKVKGKEYGWINIGGKKYEIFDVLKPFERAFTSLGNSLRVIKFRTEAEKMYEKGITFENNPEEFKKMATRINAMTSASKPNEAFKSDIVNMAIWSPRLMASKLNILGISDLASYTPLVKQGYYRSLGEKGKVLSKQQLYAAADLAKFATAVVAGSYLFASARGGQLNTDPFDNNFMDVELPNGKSYNFTGGFSKYISTLFQITRGGKVNRMTGEFEKYKGFKDRGSEIMHFFRGKTPPVSGSFINLAVGKDYTGKETSLATEAEKYKMPMAIGQIYNQIEKDGYGSLFGQGFPTFLGINVKDERDYMQTGLFTKEDINRPELKALTDKGLSVPRLSVKETYKVKRDEAHPEGVMTDDEYKELSIKVHDYMINGWEDEDGNMENGIKDLLNTSYNVQTYTETDEEEPSKEETILGKDLPAEQLKSKLSTLKENAIKKAIEDMGLTKKSKIVVKEED